MSSGGRSAGGGDYVAKNRHSWNQRVAYHVASEMYDVEGFKKGASSLKDIELGLLGDVAGKSLLHLQCHFGQDTLSLARMGARVTGVDFSDVAIHKARELAGELGLEASFVCTDLYDFPTHTDERFDIVFTSYGTIGWLPDIDRWAGVVSRHVKPGGMFVLVEFHPVMWMFDDDFQAIAYRYAASEPIIETVHGTYADRDAPITSETVSWNHSLSEVVNALIGHGLRLEGLHEYDYSPYDCFAHGEAVAEGRYRVKHLGDKLPMVYAVVARA